MPRVRSLRACAVLTAMLAGSMTSLAQEPNDILSQFDPLLGKTWICRSWDGADAEQERIIHWEMILDGNAIRETVEVPEIGFRREGLIYWDPEREEVVRLIVTNNGLLGHETVSTENGKIVFHGKMIEAQGDRMGQGETYEYLSDGTLRFISYVPADGDWRQRHILEYTAGEIVPPVATPPQMGSGMIAVDGGRLFYDEAGSGDCIVLVHDGLVHREIWEAQFPVLARTHRVVRYDRRGYGKSDVPQAQYSNVADLLCVFEQLGIERAWLMGMSAGGGLCLDFTIAHPERVVGLILTGAVVGGFDYTNHMNTRGGRLTREILTDPEALRRYMVMTDPYEMAPTSIAARARVKALLEAYPGNTALERHHLALPPETPALGRLGEIRVPTLLIVGEHDIADVHAHAGAIDAGIPGARRVVLNGAGHLVPMEAPKAFLAEVQTFLKEGPFFRALSEEGVATAVAEYVRFRKAHPDEAPFTEARLNYEGYLRLQTGQVDEAIELFKLNVQAYPESWNVYDSLAEAYMTRGDRELAIANYETSLELNPENAGGRQRLEELRTGR